VKSEMNKSREAEAPKCISVKGFIRG